MVLTELARALRFYLRHTTSSLALTQGALPLQLTGSYTLSTTPTKKPEDVALSPRSSNAVRHIDPPDNPIASSPVTTSVAIAVRGGDKRLRGVELGTEGERLSTSLQCLDQ